MWLIGAAISAAGHAGLHHLGYRTSLLFALAITISHPNRHFRGMAARRNYLEHLFPTPPRLITSIYAAHAVLLAYAAGNALVFAEYSLASFGCTPSDNSASLLSPVRVGAALSLTFVVLLHGLHIPWGLRLQNALGGPQVAHITLRHRYRRGRLSRTCAARRATARKLRHLERAVGGLAYQRECHMCVLIQRTFPVVLFSFHN